VQGLSHVVYSTGYLGSRLLFVRWFLFTLRFADLAAWKGVILMAQDPGPRKLAVKVVNILGKEIMTNGEVRI
jgi:hypothetical protein